MAPHGRRAAGGTSDVSSWRGDGYPQGKGQRRPTDAASLKLPSIAKSRSEPALAKSKSLTRQSQSLPQLHDQRGQRQQQVGVPAEDQGAPQTREAARALVEVLANPDIKVTAAKYYQNQLPDKRGRLGFRDLRQVLKSLNSHLGVPMTSTAGAEQLFKRFDFDGNGDLSLDEFFELFVTALRRQAFDRSALMGKDCFIGKEPGKVWDNYHRVKTLGKGSFGAAHLGRHKRTGQDCVIKAVEKSKAKVPVEDIEKEILVMKQMDHPHIIRLYEWYEGSTTIYLVIDALKGGTVRDALLAFQSKGQSVPEAWTRSVMKQVLEAMAYCHSMRIIHKDLKDENIMLLDKEKSMVEPFVVIIDLGVSEMFSGNDPTGKIMGGTPTTMAPEVWSNNFGPKCDVWSVGCVLYEMLTGNMPFMARSMNPRDWQALHRHGANWSKIQTSRESRQLCQDMLTYSDRERPTMAQCLKHKWFNVDSSALGELPPEMLRPIQAFANQSELKRSLLMEIAAKLPMERAENIVKIFKKADVNQDGGTSLEELQSLFAKMGLKDKALLEKTFHALDINKDGVLSFSEFAAALLLFYGELLEERFQELFKRHDLNSDGMLSQREFGLFLERVVPMIGNGKTKPADIMSKMFPKGQSEISYEDLRDKLLPTAKP